MNTRYRSETKIQPRLNFNEAIHSVGPRRYFAGIRPRSRRLWCCNWRGEWKRKERNRTYEYFSFGMPELLANFSPWEVSIPALWRSGSHPCARRRLCTGPFHADVDGCIWGECNEHTHTSEVWRARRSLSYFSREPRLAHLPRGTFACTLHRTLLQDRVGATAPHTLHGQETWARKDFGRRYTSAGAPMRWYRPESRIKRAIRITPVPPALHGAYRRERSNFKLRPAWPYNNGWTRGKCAKQGLSRSGMLTLIRPRPTEVRMAIRRFRSPRGLRNATRDGV